LQVEWSLSGSGRGDWIPWDPGAGRLLQNQPRLSRERNSLLHSFSRRRRCSERYDFWCIRPTGSWVDDLTGCAPSGQKWMLTSEVRYQFRVAGWVVGRTLSKLKKSSPHFPPDFLHRTPFPSLALFSLDTRSHGFHTHQKKQPAGGRETL